MREGEKGLKLVEVLIILAILAVLGAVVVPSTVLMPKPVFEVRSLVITPSEAEVGSPITIEASVENAAKVGRTQSVALTVDGLVIDTRDVTLDSGATETVTFTYYTDVGGFHEVELDGLTSAFVLLPVSILPPLVSNPAITISSVQDKSQIPWHPQLRGGVSESAVLSSGLNVYVLVYPIESNGPWWVQPPVVLEPSGYWEAGAYFGRDPEMYPEDKGDLFYVIVIATGQRLEPGQQWYSIPDYDYASNPILVRRE